jgi:expansin (peptidoglycan-binding protein)
MKKGTVRFFAMVLLLALFVTGSVPAFAAPVSSTNANAVVVSPRNPGAETDSNVPSFNRATLYWNNVSIAYNTRTRFISSYTGGYFILDGVTASFTVSTTNGANENIEIDWYDSNGNSTVLFSGSTSSTTVYYYSAGRESGNFRVWNKSAAGITVNASITY